MMKNPVSAEVLAKLTGAAAQGRQAWKRGAISEAESHFLDAWNALPDPKLEQDYAQSLSWGLTTFYKGTNQFEKAKAWLDTVRRAYGPGPNDSVEFLAATVAFDAGDLEEAFRIFHVLFLKFGTRPFEGHDSKYLDFYNKRVA
jgi:hypothetical protein